MMHQPQLLHRTVASGNLYSIDYVPETQALTIEFKNGSVYRYANVPVELYCRFETADQVEPYKSYGKFFHAEILTRYTAEKIRDPNPKPEKETSNEDVQKDGKAGPDLEAQKG